MKVSKFFAQLKSSKITSLLTHISVSVDAADWYVEEKAQIFCCASCDTVRWLTSCLDGALQRQTFTPFSLLFFTILIPLKNVNPKKKSGNSCAEQRLS